ncbi:MAG TPA: hypothetical protein VFJ16_28560 [Longimicrobium sp.]|nr:hypothetical protein [Longimicrobium sp.]
MKVYAGRTFMYPNGGIPHLWIVVTEPSGTPAEVVIVSLSSEKAGKDATVKLGPGDHPFIRKPTVVFYPDTRLMPVQSIINEVQNAQATFHADCSEDLLDRVRQGLLASPATPRRLKAYVRERI